MIASPFPSASCPSLPSPHGTHEPQAPDQLATSAKPGIAMSSDHVPGNETPHPSSPNGTLEPQESDRLVTSAHLGIAMSSPVAGGTEKPQDWERHRHAIMTDLAPIGIMETIAAEDVAQILWELDRCRRQRVKAIDEGQVHLEEDVEAMVKNPKLARTRIEKIVVEQLRPCYERNARSSAKENEAQWEYDGEIIRAGLTRLRDLQTIPDEDQRKMIRSEEGAIRRALKDAMAEIRRLRKERQVLERVQKPAPAPTPAPTPAPAPSRRRPKPIDRSSIQEPIGQASINKVESVAILQAIAALLQPTVPEAVTVEGPETSRASKIEASVNLEPVESVDVVSAIQVETQSGVVAGGCAIDRQLDKTEQILPEQPQPEQIQATAVDPEPCPPIATPIPPEKPRSAVLKAPIVRPPTQEGKWVGLGGIPILYERPQPRG